MLPRSIRKLIEEFSEFPSVGPKTAERYLSYLLKQPKERLETLGREIAGLKDDLVVCQNCLNIAEQNPCPICADPTRDRSLLCVVSDGRNVNSIESTGQYRGLYYVIGGEINPVEGLGPEQLNLKKLMEKIKSNGIAEIILALNPTIEGETTSLYLSKTVKAADPRIKITKLARGLPAGAELEYADEITLANALKYRVEQK